MLVFALSIEMSKFFTSEADRAQKVREVLRKHGINTASTLIEKTNFRTDGDMQLDNSRYVIIEVKNEIGTQGAEPYAQGTLCYFHSAQEFSVSNKFNFPCIVITVFGKF
jgi:hypothetical protein